MSLVYWENLVIASADPGGVGRFWAEALGATPVCDRPESFQARLEHEGGPVLDLCVDRVHTVATDAEAPLRLHLDLRGGEQQRETVDRLLGLGASLLDIGQGDVAWEVMADPDGLPFCVMESREAYLDTGPVAALPLDSSDPDRDLALWQWLTGWVVVPGVAPYSLRHPSLRGPLLELCPEAEPHGAAPNRVHLDFRLEPGDDPDEVALGILARGGRELPPEGGTVRRQRFVDASGNEFCVLPR